MAFGSVTFISNEGMMQSFSSHDLINRRRQEEAALFLCFLKDHERKQRLRHGTFDTSAVEADELVCSLLQVVQKWTPWMTSAHLCSEASSEIIGQ